MSTAAAPAVPAETADVPPKSGKKKKLIIILAVVLMLPWPVAAEPCTG